MSCFLATLSASISALLLSVHFCFSAASPISSSRRVRFSDVVLRDVAFFLPADFFFPVSAFLFCYRRQGRYSLSTDYSYSSTIQSFYDLRAHHSAVITSVSHLFCYCMYKSVFILYVYLPTLVRICIMQLYLHLRSLPVLPHRSMTGSNGRRALKPILML